MAGSVRMWCGLALIALPACQADSAGGWNWLAPEGEPWSILCIECTGADHAQRSDEIAESLRRTEGVRWMDVKVVHAPTESRVHYGTYYRKIGEKTGRLTVPPQMEADLKLILELATDNVRFFPSARMAPAPVPDVGRPEWAVERADGVYTLLVAIFQNTADFYQRKEAAAQYVEYLRGHGYEAFYHHGSVTSEVMVGTFGEDAMVQAPHNAAAGVVLDRYSPEVRALQAKEEFRYELWNGARRLEVIGDMKAAIPSRLVRIDEFKGVEL